MTSEISAKLPPQQFGVSSQDPASHITVIEQVYFQVPYEEAEGLETRYTRLVTSSEEPFNKRKVVTLIPFYPFNSFDNVSGTVVIKNLEGVNLQKIPTKEQKEEIENSVLHVFLHGSTYTPILVRPGATCRFEVESVDCVFLKSSNEKPIKTRSYMFPSS